MKNVIVSGMIAAASGLFVPPAAHAQPSVYVSNLAAPSTGSAAVGNDSWQGELFLTGGNPGGYVLDSVQLEMAPGSGIPNDVSVTICAAAGTVTSFPGKSLDTLSGPSDPVAGGLYTYTASGLTLGPSTAYYLVLGAGSPVESGDYAWTTENYTGSSATGGWTGTYFLLKSPDGSSWIPTSADPEFALTATAVPEPDTLVLLGLPGLVFFTRRLWHGTAAR